MARRVVWGLVAAGAALAGCGGGSSQVPDGAAPIGNDCSDLFSQDSVRTYSVDIDPAEWQSLDAEFHDIAALQATGNEFATYHPIVFHLDQETVNASIKLHGASSWLQAVMFDGDRAKMQFTIAFNKTDPNGKFHGLDKLTFDMPRSDWTFMHDRLAHAWLRQSGIMAGCAASARLNINGKLYGLYVVEEEVSRRVVAEFFPNNADGDLWKGGVQPETSPAKANYTRINSFQNATDMASISAIVDLDGSVHSWAAEALLNDADGYYGGFHNFYLYDQGQKGYVFLPQDLDATFDWLALFDLPAANDHPVFWWEARAKPAPQAGPIWPVVMADSGWRKKYADAIADVLAHWDVAQIQGWIDTWSGQIAADVPADPHAWATADDFNMAIQKAREIVATRADYLKTFVDCENGAGEDKDGDGARWCDDCRDDDPSIHLGAAETCNGVDDNCNGTVDEGCQ